MSIAPKLRDMHALSAESCDPEFRDALLEAAKEIEWLHAIIQNVSFAIGHEFSPLLLVDWPPMATLTDRHGKVIRHEADTLADWKQAAGVEAGLRREFQTRLRVFAQWVADHSNDPGVVKRARDALEI